MYTHRHTRMNACTPRGKWMLVLVGVEAAWKEGGSRGFILEV